jgi:alpha-beta hydrolase superfamily lysophospholipase
MAHQPPQTGQVIVKDGTKLHTARWLAETPRAVVMLMHGIAEHSGRYAHVAEYLAGRGYTVCAHDHRGHGRSDGLRTYFESFDVAVADAHEVLDAIRTDFDGLPVFVFGHSMGSLISTLFCLEYQALLAGFISSGSPLLVGSNFPKPVRSLMAALFSMAPRLNAYPLNVEAISSDPAEVAKNKADPLVDHKKVRLGMAANLSRSTDLARERVPGLHLPLLILHGSADRLTPPAGSQYLYDHAGSADKTLRFFEGMYHEVHNDHRRAEMMQVMGDWLDAHAAPRA